MKRYQIALYIRLSKEEKESCSIQTQRSLLEGYTAEHFTEYDLLEFCDKGYTGINFQRPAVQQLLKRARKLEIHCIIVKDFSRFSRDYIELGSYLEQIFPFLGIRFISINDHYDSQKYQGSIGNLDMNFKNLLYDLYSKDLSRKVRSSLTAKKEQGKYVSGIPPFGYKKADLDRYALIIAEEEAKVVRRIFSLTLEGYTSGAIARLLNQEGVVTPLESRRKNNQKKENICRKSTDDSTLWNSSTICRILKNEVYTGCILQKKTQRETVGGKNRCNPRKDWLVTYHHHEPIIAKEIFDQIQEKRGRSRGSSSCSSHPLTGKLVCGCCKKNLIYHKGKKAYFTCQYRYVNGKEACIQRVDVERIEQQIGKELQRRLIEQREVEESQIWSDLPIQVKKTKKKEVCDNKREEQEQLKKKEQKLISQIQKLKQQSFQAYQNYVYGRSDCFPWKDSRLLSLEAELAKVIQAIQDGERGKRENVHWSDVYGEKNRSGEKHRLDVPLLSKREIDQYIQRILVYVQERIEIEWTAVI
ncbi:MAG: recombinase family protein [Lachnospiraceae bacterium]|nr:recombinase family protein [Lachnospiraceae bacterium]